MFSELKEKLAVAFDGEVKLTKLDFCLLATCFVLAGMCIGLLTAPFTHGVSVFSHNGCDNGNNSFTKLPLEEEEQNEDEEREERE